MSYSSYNHDTEHIKSKLKRRNSLTKHCSSRSHHNKTAFVTVKSNPTEMHFTATASSSALTEPKVMTKTGWRLQFWIHSVFKGVLPCSLRSAVIFLTQSGRRGGDSLIWVLTPMHGWGEALTKTQQLKISGSTGSLDRLWTIDAANSQLTRHASSIAGIWTLRNVAAATVLSDVADIFTL